MSRVIFETLWKHYPGKPKGVNYNSEQLENISRLVATVLSKAVKSKDDAALSLLASSVNADVTYFFERKFSSDDIIKYNVKNTLQRLKFRLLGESIALDKDPLKPEKLKLKKEPVSEAQHAILRGSIEELNDLTDVFTTYTLLMAPREIKLHPGYYKVNGCNDQHMQLMLSCGVSPTHNNAVFNQNTLPASIKQNAFNQILYRSKKSGVTQVRHTEPLSDELSLESIPCEHFIALLYSAKRYTDLLDKRINGLDLKLEELLESVGPTPTLNALLEPDFSDCLSYLSNTHSITKVIERHAELCMLKRPLIAKTEDGFIKRGQLTLRSANVFNKLQEDVLFTRAAAKHIDKLCQVLANNFISVQEKIAISDLNKSLYSFFCLELSASKSASNAQASNVYVSNAIIDLELKGVASLLGRILSKPIEKIKDTERKENRSAYRLDEVIEALPTKTLRVMLAQGLIDPSHLHLVCEAINARNYPLFYSLHPEFSTKTMAELIAQGEKSYPGFSDSFNTKTKVENTLRKLSETKGFDYLSPFAKRFTSYYYDDFECIKRSVSQNADVSFLEKGATL